MSNHKPGLTTDVCKKGAHAEIAKDVPNRQFI